MICIISGSPSTWIRYRNDRAQRPHGDLLGGMQRDLVSDHESNDRRLGRGIPMSKSGLRWHYCPNEYGPRMTLNMAQ